jgi:redox-sensitive bicupin YhaK (pirin superfamily)
MIAELDDAFWDRLLGRIAEGEVVPVVGPGAVTFWSLSLRRASPQTDPAFGPLSVVDHANLDVGTLVHMHEHTNDEILTYLWRGTMVHEDSGGYKVALSPNKLMMMNAGRGFWHEESTPETPVAALQIFIRPLEADLAAGVQFFDRPAPISTGHWHLIGGPATADDPSAGASLRCAPGRRTNTVGADG